MSLIPEAELPRMRVEAELTFDATATIQRVTRTSDGSGGFTPSFTTIALNVPCSIGQSPRFREQRITADRSVDEALLVIDFRWNTDIKTEDRVTILGIVYIVTQPDPPMPEMITRSALAKAL